MNFEPFVQFMYKAGYKSLVIEMKDLEEVSL